MKIQVEGKYSVNDNGVLVFKTVFADIEVKGFENFSNYIIALSV
jgi:hypothetical protein